MKRLIAESDFAVQMLQLLPNNESSVFSPLSISFALAILHSGAKGNTKHQIEDAILKGDKDFIEHHSSLLKSITSPKYGVEFNIANRFYLRDNYPIHAEYLSDIDKMYAAKAVPMDFNNGDACAKEVNNFISEATKGKIGPMVMPATFAAAVAIIVNAIYMKAEWSTKFTSEDTREGTFTGLEGTTRKVRMMSKSNVNRDYYSDDSVQALTLKYKDESYKFTWILPVEKNGFEKVRSELTGAKLQQILNAMVDTKVNIKVPKMKEEGDLKLVELLKSLGITDLFGNADLSGISDGLRISDAKHKAFMEVDEEGTVAAAVSVMVGFGCCMPVYAPIDFTADHPFLYVISYENHPVFIGQFV